MVIAYQILLFLVTGYALYFSISGLFALKSNHKKPTRHAPKYRFAILIAARNEAEVIGGLLESLNNQNYPKDLYEIFVIPNNCSDLTEQVAKHSGATIISPPPAMKISAKGQALKYAMEILSEREDIDVFAVFDADNVVHPDYLKRMNDACCEGAGVAQGFRDSKNYSDNWISGGYSIFYWYQNFFFNRARMIFNGSASINGTGFILKKDVFLKNGFDTYTMTEDIEFTAQCAINQEKILFVEDAVTYDEQPIHTGTSWTQRRRWSTGTMQCFKRYSGSLLGGFFKGKGIHCLDMFMNFAAPYVQILSFLLLICRICFSIFGVVVSDVISYFYSLGIIFLLATYIISIIMSTAIVLYNKKNPIKALPGILMFPVFIIMWIPINITCLFYKSKKWVQIQHNRNISADTLFSYGKEISAEITTYSEDKE